MAGARINIYVPADIAIALETRPDINVSSVCQQALRTALDLTVPAAVARDRLDQLELRVARLEANEPYWTTAEVQP